RFYPPENRELQLRMMREQLVVSQFPAGAPIVPHNFVARNRTIALLSDAVVIAEAKEGARGSVSLGWAALRLGRPLYIWRDTYDAGFPWTALMARYGALRLDEDGLDRLAGSPGARDPRNFTGRPPIR
ncbi:MAG: DNA-processing protein DprA, partial [Conexivisphaera sp.]